VSVDPLDELAVLVADLRAALEDVRARGVVSEARDALLPSAIVPAQAVAAPVAGPVAGGAWANIAVEARKDAEARSVVGAEGLRRIREDLGDCRRCGLCQGRRNIVFGVGSPQTDLVIVGEGPGHDEDLKGEPFVGPAGQMLDKMLENVLGLARPEVYILNVVKCRPPQNRNPLPDEIAACRPFMERQIEALAPKVLLVLGTIALKSLLGTDAGIMKNRGVWQTWRSIPVMPTFHPAYLLRNPDDKRKTFGDLKLLRERYDALGGRREPPSL
jgi:DNA polymerase